MTISVCRCLKRKTMLVWVKEYINKNCNLQKSLLLARILYWFQGKTPRCKYWVLKVLYLETQMVYSGWLKNDSLCLRIKHSSKCSAACRCNGRRLDIKRLDQINFVFVFDHIKLKIKRLKLRIRMKIVILLISITIFLFLSFYKL